MCNGNEGIEAAGAPLEQARTEEGLAWTLNGIQLHDDTTLELAVEGGWLPVRVHPVSTDCVQVDVPYAYAAAAYRASIAPINVNKFMRFRWPRSAGPGRLPDPRRVVDAWRAHLLPFVFPTREDVGLVLAAVEFYVEANRGRRDEDLVYQVMDLFAGRDARVQSERVRPLLGSLLDAYCATSAGIQYHRQRAEEADERATRAAAAARELLEQLRLAEAELSFVREALQSACETTETSVRAMAVAACAALRGEGALADMEG